MAEKVLLIEDEEKLARMVELELQYEGYQVEKALDGRCGAGAGAGERWGAMGPDGERPTRASRENLFDRIGESVYYDTCERRGAFEGSHE